MLLQALSVLLASTPGLPGGFSPVDEIGPTSKMHKLAVFSLDALNANVCAASNSFVCGRLTGTSVKRVKSARQQVVSGMNYEIECETSAGVLLLRLYEQVWTQTLLLRSASLSAPVGGASMAVQTFGDALGEIDPKELKLNAQAFAAVLAVHECEGGMVWNECGSHCPKTCDDPAPMCIMSCNAVCECPPASPILKDGKCVTMAECSAIEPAAADCVPNANAPCPRIYAPVCADGKTYANACLAKADCKTEFEEGVCPEQPGISPLLIGGAPIAAVTRGGHYTGSDSELFAKAAQEESTQAPEAILLEQTTESEKASFTHGQQVVSIVTLCMALMLLITMGAFLISRAGAKRDTIVTTEATPMRSADAQDAIGVRMDNMVEDKSATATMSKA